MKDTLEKRVLIVSNTGLSPDTSNGRTMAVLLKAFNRDSLAQFYLHGKPDEMNCLR